MMIQTPVIQIDRTDHRSLVVRHKNFGMHKTRRILVNLHTGLHQFLIIRSGDDERIFFIRDMGHQDHHLDATPGRIRQRPDHLMIQDQIRRHDMYIFPCRIQDIQIYPPPRPCFSVRADVIWDKKSVRFSVKFRSRLVFQIGFLSLFSDVPHFQEHKSKPFHRVAFQPDRRVLPMAEAFFPVNVLVRKICPARMSDPAVDDQDLPVIPVVVMAGKYRVDRSIHFAPDTVLFEYLRIEIRKQRQRAHPVVHHTHLHALRYFLLQHLQNLMPQVSFFDNEVLHKDKLLCAPQVFHQRFELDVP